MLVLVRTTEWSNDFCDHHIFILIWWPYCRCPLPMKSQHIYLVHFWIKRSNFLCEWDKKRQRFRRWVFSLCCGHRSHLIENIYVLWCCVCMLEIKTFVNSYRKRVEMNFFQIIINLIDQASHFGHMGVFVCVCVCNNQSNIHHRTDNIRLNMESMNEKNMDKVKHGGARRAKEQKDLMPGTAFQQININKTNIYIKYVSNFRNNNFVTLGVSQSTLFLLFYFACNDLSVTILNSVTFCIHNIVRWCC